MPNLQYIFTKKQNLFLKTNSQRINFQSKILFKAIKITHRTIDKLVAFDIDIMDILGMRNLSTIIGELFVRAIEKTSHNVFIRNPHQDGYPDLLSLHKEGLSHWKKLKGRLKEKGPFSPFKEGGIEIKATCGAVPNPNICSKKGITKPGMKDTRISVMTSYDWKAHHRKTNNLVGILWDFIEKKPRIVAVFYSNKLQRKDWGKIVQPKKGGGRTTSVSIMTRKGIKKMYEGYVAVVKDQRYIAFLNKYNKGDLIK